MITRVYYDGQIHVRKHPCEDCLFSRRRLVNTRAARKILAEIAEKGDGASFVCHEPTDAQGKCQAVCSVWYHRHGVTDWVFRLAAGRGHIEYV